MSISRLPDWVRRFFQRPTTVDLSRLNQIVGDAGERAERAEGLSDADLTAAAANLHRTAGGGKAFSDDELAEVCTLGREAARRTLGERAFDVQLLGTLGLLSGHAVEMATGEGKTLSGALAAAGFALQGRPVHVVSVNDYLARRDAEWMRPLYESLGVSVGWIDQTSTRSERYAAYRAQVTYASVSEIGFDLLRDRLSTDTPDTADTADTADSADSVDPAELVVPEPGVAIVDEADSVMVDEARVPLVLAGSVTVEDVDRQITDMVGALRPGRHYEVDEEGRSAALTDAGTQKVEEALGDVDLYTDTHTETLARVNVALHARALLHRDVDYIVRDGKVHLINASRGRVARLQRWPDGLQAAIEAKEGLEASKSGEILDSITVQALIGRYPTVCGMTGTAVAVAEQLREFYQLDVAVVPPNRPCVREDEPDRLFAREEDKRAALVEHVASAHATGQPVLIGTQDVAESEKLAGRLREAGLPCVVLNAKNDAEEAAIVAEAGVVGAITVSTQMAGRGTDIRLGGADQEQDHDRVAELGGLYVVGSGRHTSSRLDDQLRGRAGRQGDPGSSVFFTSMRDDLVTQYAPDARPVDHTGSGEMLGRREQETLEHAQSVAEGVHLELHRNTWRYNRIIDYQRAASLELRDEVRHTAVAARELGKRCPDRYEQLRGTGEDTVVEDTVVEDTAVEDTVDEGVLDEAARQIALYHLDRGWTEHLAYLADLREGIHLRGLGRHINPLDEFNSSAVAAFKPLAEQMWTRAAETFEAVPITGEGADLAGAGLKRPTATWTYLVHDNPFGSEDERAMRALVSMFRKKSP